MCQGDASARAMLEEGLSLARANGDRRIIKDFMLGLALVRFYLHDLSVRDLLREALTISREIGDRRGIAFALNNLGLVEGIEKDFVLAREYHEQSLPLLRAMGDQWSTARALAGLGRAAWFEGDITAARAYYQENLAILRDLGSQWELIYTFEGFAWLALHQDNPQRAARLMGAGEALREATGHVLFPVARPCYEECLAKTRHALAEKYDQSTVAAVWRAGRALSREEAIAEALKR
jgi:tetratricopeptide (TPR) repeat protein